MSLSNARERLSTEDAMFLYLDTEDMPMHIASVMVFDSPIPLKDFRRLIGSKLPQIPRYRQRVVAPPLNLGHPHWEFDPAFDIKHHIIAEHLDSGADQELQALAGRILSQAMDRSKPLWDITLVDGLQGGRGAMICRVHHCLADGIAGVKLLEVILDSNPKRALARAKTRPEAPSAAPDPAMAVVDGVLASYAEIVDRVVSMQSYALNVAEAVIANGFGAIYQLLRVVPDLFGPFQGLPFNKPCLGARKLVWTEVPLADVMALRQATGAKLNDIVVSMVTTAIRRYTQLHRTAVKDRTLRMMVPVNIRGRDGINGPGLGNRISMMSVNLPLDVSDPLKQLHVVHETMTALKQGGVADFVGVAGNWLALTPTPLQALLGPYGSQLPFPPWNMVCTNVPGPQVTLYALGRRLIASYPYVPIGARMGLNCAVQSYDGKLFFGFTVSDTAAPDGAIMPKLLDSAFAELCKKAKVKRTKTIDAIAAEGKEPTAQDKLERPRARASHNGHKVADAHLNGGPPAPLKTELAAAKTAPEPAPV